MVRFLFSTFFIVCLFSTTFAITASSQRELPNLNSIKKLNSQQLSFTHNNGQWDDEVLFQAKANGVKMWFTADGAYYQFTRRLITTEMAIEAVFGSDEIVDSRHSHLPFECQDMDTRLRGYDIDRNQLESIMIKASFVGTKPEPKMIGLEEMRYKCNYFIGSDSSEWYTDVPNYQAILYEDIYSGVDLKYYSTNGQMEYDFIISPGADLAQIQIKYEGTRSVNINESGELVIETDWGEIIERQPFIYQELDDQRIEIAGEYTLVSENTFTFKLSEKYNPQLAVVIDPVLSFGTYLGGSASDELLDIEVDNNGYAYVIGYSESFDFPTFNPFQIYLGGDYNVILTKLSTTGEGLIYSSYLGAGYGIGHSITIDDEGNIYLTGGTGSGSFPTLNSLQQFNGTYTAFITKINNDGNALIYSTLLGGSIGDWGTDITVDVSGNAYITGVTRSSDFPTINHIQEFQGGYSDVFVSMIDSNCNNLLFSTCIGGSKWDEGGRSIAIDSDNNIYVVGETSDSDFPIVNSLDAHPIDTEGFILKISSETYELVFSTYWGGNDYDFCSGVTIDNEDNIYISGITESYNFQVANPFQETFMSGWRDGFVTKLNGSTYDVIYSTYLGGSGDDVVTDIIVDNVGNAYVTGFTQSTNFPTLYPWQMKHRWSDIFVTKLNSNGDSLLFSTYLGGNGWDDALGIAIDTLGNIYVAGQTNSDDFPVLNSSQPNSGFTDAFVVKLSPYSCGNVDGRGFIDISDVVYLIAYLFSGGPAPEYLQAGDADCDGEIGLTDAVYLINYIFVGGPAPCESCT